MLILYTAFIYCILYVGQYVYNNPWTIRSRSRSRPMRLKWHWHQSWNMHGNMRGKRISRFRNNVTTLNTTHSPNGAMPTIFNHISRYKEWYIARIVQHICPERSCKRHGHPRSCTALTFPNHIQTSLGPVIDCLLNVGTEARRICTRVGQCVRVYEYL